MPFRAPAHGGGNYYNNSDDFDVWLSGGGLLLLFRVPFQGITFTSICYHHFLPFYGTIDVVYEPGEVITGLGRIVELVQALAHRLQIQDEALAQILCNEARPECYRNESGPFCSPHAQTRQSRQNTIK